MRVRIEAVISTAGNNEEYVGRHLGLRLIGRPLTKMVVTFEEELTTEEKFDSDLADSVNAKTFLDELCEEMRHGPQAIQIHSVRIIHQ